MRKGTSLVPLGVLTFSFSSPGFSANGMPTTAIHCSSLRTTATRCVLKITVGAMSLPGTGTNAMPPGTRLSLGNSAAPAVRPASSSRGRAKRKMRDWVFDFIASRHLDAA
jgi:hypothetical protein